MTQAGLGEAYSGEPPASHVPSFPERGVSEARTAP